MHILIIGNGGREHALAWKCAQSAQVEKVTVAPGNAGTALEPKCQNVDIAVTDINGLLAYVNTANVDLTIVGPEAALAAGVVDAFQTAGHNIFGPTQAAAQLESSKQFCKDFLTRHQIPTANYSTFTAVDDALRYLNHQALPIVIKADGLAAGKGVVIAHTFAEAEAAVRDMLEGNAFGDAGSKVVIEQFLVGVELSVIVMCDGEHILPLADSQDHKRRFEHDQGPNTGGMGAYSPTTFYDDALRDNVMQTILLPTLKGMRNDGLPYTGFLYAGLMIVDGEPYVLEYNCRMGDPETQPILMRLESDLPALCVAALNGRLDQTQASWDPRVALGVVMCSDGYPGDYKKGLPIHGLADAAALKDVKVFHAGTTLTGENVVTNGGRVLCVTALGDTHQEAQQRAYAAVNTINWQGASKRTDIGWRAIHNQYE